RPQRRAAGGGHVVGAGIAFGAAVAGAATGVAAGLLALDRLGELEERCPSKRCSPADQPIADAANRYATVSTIGFVAAGLGAAVGIGVLVWPKSQATGAATIERATLTLELAPTSAWLRGRF
ncbi:MAG: hypothetical protein FJ096_22215, partial [Deltaproteobacteria bacterium]|nr:hypothetical protein [Deltaproteobacteria bacterium]